MTDRITIRRPDDWHLHLRDDAMLQAVLPPTARVFGRAIVMPNLKPPVTTSAMAAAYRQRILDALPEGSSFTPLMTLYLTDRTDPADLVAGARDGVVTAVKLYPAGATTNSDSGVSSFDALDPVLGAMEDAGIPLLVHGEVTDAHVDIFDREARFLDEVLGPMMARHQGLRVVFEHATTADAVQFVRAHADRMGCTLTPQHLLLNRNDMLVGGIRPHLYCLPILKRATHQRALVEAATSGESNFFLGTDSAPHLRHTKESDCGCAGCFSAPAALELYASVFEAEDRLHALEGFASLHGAAFYGLEPHEERITLVRERWTVPHATPVSGDPEGVVNFHGGQPLGWKLLG